MTDLEEFVGRVDALRKKKRYADTSSPLRFDVMMYRTHLELHTKRVRAIGGEFLAIAAQVYGANLDQGKYLALLEVHDDAEIITPDHSLAKKSQMTPAELADLKHEEELAIEELASRYPKTIRDCEYRSLLYHASRKDCLEAQLVSLADKLDGYGECCHEVFAGNGTNDGSFERAARDYVKRLCAFGKTFPGLGPLLEESHPLLDRPDQSHVDWLIANARLHTRDSVREPTASPHYDRWRELTIAYLGVEFLVERKEQ